MNTNIDFQIEIEKTVKSFGPICDKKLWEHSIEIIKSGKKLRPNFVILLWEHCLPKQDIPNELINDLVALELIHTSTLIHDDIIDKGLFRRNIKTINYEYGDEIALLMGNVIKDWAIKFSTPKSTISLNAASFDVNLGQLWETLAREHKTININHYLAIVLFKTAKIFTHSIDIFSSYSKVKLAASEKNMLVAMAILYQIEDDLLDHLKTSPKDKSIGQDKKNNVHSFIYASFDDDIIDLAYKDGVCYTDEVYFIRKYIDIVKKSYNFQSKIEELPAEKQLSYLIDLCQLLMAEAKIQNVNNEINQVLSIYFENILSSINHLQLR